MLQKIIGNKGIYEFEHKKAFGLRFGSIQDPELPEYTIVDQHYLWMWLRCT